MWGTWLGALDPDTPTLLPGLGLGSRTLLLSPSLTDSASLDPEPLLSAPAPPAPAGVAETRGAPENKVS